MPEPEASEFVRLFRALPIRERSIMFELLFTDMKREEVAQIYMVSMDRLDAIEAACRERLGMA